MTKTHICPIIWFGRFYAGPAKTGTMGVPIRPATAGGVGFAFCWRLAGTLIL